MGRRRLNVLCVPASFSRSTTLQGRCSPLLHLSKCSVSCTEGVASMKFRPCQHVHKASTGEHDFHPPITHKCSNMPEPIVFYDIPRKATVPSENAWSPNTWKTRYSLNIKGLAYKTVWIEYPDIEALYKKLGVEPVDIGPTGAPYCGLPLIYDPNTGAKVNDSASIARYLDKTYPDTPTLIPKETDALHAAFQRAFAAVLISGNGDFPSLMMPETQARLNPASQGYFRRTREEWFGTALEELAPHGSEKRRKHWEGVKNAFHEVAGWLQAGGQDNLVFLGNQRICYADVTVAAFLVWLRITFGEASEEWKDVLTWDGGRWAKFAEAFREYEHVDEGSSLVL